MRSNRRTKKSLANFKTEALPRTGSRSYLIKQSTILDSYSSKTSFIATRKISSLRNKLAHDLSFEITEQDVLDLANCTSPKLRKSLQSDKGADAGPLELYDLLKGNLVMLETQRQQNAASRELQKKAFLKVRLAAERFRLTVGR